MRIGVFLAAAGATVEELTGQVRAAADAGLDSAFFGQFGLWDADRSVAVTGPDALMVAALAGRDVPGIEIGTAVTPTYPRHPFVLASQALTARAITGDRFTLGVGPSHRQLVEGGFGLSYDRPARHVREYLTALRPLLRGEPARYQGETLSVAGQVQVPGATPPPVLMSALGPVMLRVAGELADGVVTTWTNAAGIADHIVPGVTRAAAEAGRPAPRVLAGTILTLTDDPDGVRRRLEQQLGFAGDFPGYRAILDRQGLNGVHETAVAGDERHIEKEVRRFADAGATDLLVSVLGDGPTTTRTLELLGALRGSV